MDVHHSDLTPRVRHIIMDLVPGPPDRSQSLDADLPLTEIGLDSLLLVELVARLEDELDIEFPDDALRPESFASLRATVDTVDRLR